MMQLKISSIRENRSWDTRVIEIRILRKISSKQFCLSDANDNTSGPLNRGGIVDLSLLRTILAIFQKFQKPSFWEVINCFVLLAYASLAASRIFLQRLLAFLNFTLDSEDLSCWHKLKKWFLWTAAQAAESQGDESDLNRYFSWGIFTSIPL